MCVVYTIKIFGSELCNTVIEFLKVWVRSVRLGYKGIAKSE